MNNKYYLYFTEFFSGMAVMAVELGASRLLAPYFSSSQIVWTIIIATIMIAMALGNVLGGRSADKNPDPAKLYKRLIIAAIWIAAIPFLGKYIILGISGLLVVTISHNFLIIAAFLACMVIFVYPCYLLGTVTPSLVKYTVQSLDHSGGIVGTLGAYNTAGSIIGTFLPTFVTIPAVGTSATFIIFSCILLVLGLLYFIQRKQNLWQSVTAVILFIVLSVLGVRGGFAFWEKGLTYEGESIYNYLQVKENEDRVILSTNVLFGVQSVMEKDDSLTGMYYDYAMAAPVLAGFTDQETGDGKRNMLILGNGTGTFAKQSLRFFPDSSIEGVEIDDKITDLAHRYFALPEEEQVTTYDGRAYLQVSEELFDVIMVDAYQDITIPFQMSTIEFFEMVEKHLKPNGVMVVNMNMKTNTDGNINEYLADTIAGVFDHIVYSDVRGNTNRELFASREAISADLLKARAANLKHEDLKNLMLTVADQMQEYEAGSYILTDDKAPVELLGMEAIDVIIGDELGYYREIFQEEGLEGLLKSI